MSNPLSTPLPWQTVAPHYAAEVVPMFNHYAAHALDWAAVGPGQSVLDVACGPGTLSFQAAARGARVQAVDFAPAMIEQLQQRLAGEAGDIEAQVADGQDLPFAADTFDAAFSMFGLMFFPSRERGFAELHRVLRRGGVAVVSSWQPMDRIPLFATTFGALFSQLPPNPTRVLPLTQAADYEAEMSAAGFRDIEVESVAFSMKAPSTEAMWQSFERTNAMLVPAKEALGARWTDAWARVLDAMIAEFGEGPQTVTMPAWMARAWRA